MLALLFGFGVSEASAAGTPAPLLPPNTWTPLHTLPAPLHGPVFALAVDASGRDLLVGTGSGAIYRSTDSGSSWAGVHRPDGHAIETITFSPFTSGLVLAGTRGQGILISRDNGLSWASDQGSGTATVRSIAFTASWTVAGTDRGVLAKPAGGNWGPAGLGQLSVSTVTAAAVNPPVKLLVGADSTTGQESLPLYQTSGAVGHWSALKGPASGSTMAAVLLAGPLPKGSDTRPLLLGTNGGAFTSTDGGSTWSLLSSLPAVDFNLAAFAGDQPDRFYLASDGGGSGYGGIWYTGDKGQSFRSLKAPVGSLTALAVTGQSKPTLFVATLRPTDGTPMLWGYLDQGGRPAVAHVDVAAPATTSHGATRAPRAAPVDWKLALAKGPEAPYIAGGMAAVLVLLIALVAYLRRARI